MVASLDESHHFVLKLQDIVGLSWFNQSVQVGDILGDCQTEVVLWFEFKKRPPDDGFVDLGLTLLCSPGKASVHLVATELYLCHVVLTKFYERDLR